MKVTDQNIRYDFSIVIPTKNRNESMLKTVSSIIDSLPEDRNIEIIVIKETDSPKPDIGGKVKYVSVPERGLGFGYIRNFALKMVKDSIIIFIDDDVPISQKGKKKGIVIEILELPIMVMLLLVKSVALTIGCLAGSFKYNVVCI